MPFSPSLRIFCKLDTSNLGGQEVAGEGGEGEECLDDRGRDGNHAEAAAGAGRVPGPRGRDPAESPLRQPDRGGHFAEEGAGGGAGRTPGQVRHVSNCQALSSICICDAGVCQVQAVVHRGQARRELELQLRLRQRRDDRASSLSSSLRQLGTHENTLTTRKQSIIANLRVQVLMCGPPPMINFACTPNLDKLGYSQSNRFSY